MPGELPNDIREYGRTKRGEGRPRLLRAADGRKPPAQALTSTTAGPSGAAALALDQPDPEPKFVKLPCTSSREDKAYAHLKLLSRVRDGSTAAAFEGMLLRPGALLAFEQLPEPAVILECAGPVRATPGTLRTGSEPRRAREIVWILWTWSRSARTWRELARSASVNSDWVTALRPQAQAALDPRPELFDAIQKTRELTDCILSWIDGRIDAEKPAIKAAVLGGIYARVGAWIASLE